MVNFEIASSNSFRDIPKNHFPTAAEADICDSIKRKRIRVSLNKYGLLVILAVSTRTVSYSFSSFFDIYQQWSD